MSEFLNDVGRLAAHAAAPKFFILYILVVSAVWVHYRGQSRFRFTRQLTDHSTFFAPINCFLYAFSAVPNRPILDARDFPELKVLRDNWETIRREALSLSGSGDIKGSANYDDLAFNSFFRKGWKRFYLKWYDDFLPSARDACPETIKLLQGLPAINAAMFAMLPVGGQLVAHRDPFAGSVRYHLGLVTPNDDRCRIYIDGAPYSWRDGEDIVFDETYIHRAVNEAESDRIILFCDIERPMRTGWAEAVNRFFCRRMMRAAATKNSDSDRVGVLNRIFGVVYPFRKKMKALKKFNRKLYYLIKYVFFGSLLYLFIIA